MDNERSERPERRTAFVARELRQYDIDIAALQETRRAGEGQLTETGAGYTFFWKGKEENEQIIHGVGFAIKNELVRNLEELPIGVNERLMTLRLKLNSNDQATVISAYAPTLLAEPEDKEIFYYTLDSVLSQVPRSHKIILLGDFNARVGRDHSVWGNVIGKEGEGNANSNGVQLLTKCAEHQLMITNTLFRQKNRNKTSWRHPRSRHWHMIDYIIIRSCDRKDVLITKTMTSSDECWTDHRLIRSSMSFVLRPKQRKAKKQKRTKYNLIRLDLPEKRDEFQTKMSEALLNVENTSVECLWTGLKTAIKTTCDETLGILKRQNEDWFDDNDAEVEQMIAEKRKRFSVWQNDIRNESKKQQYHEMRSKVQHQVREMKNNWWEQKALEMQVLSDSNNSRAFFAATKKIYGPTSLGARPVAGKDGTLHKDMVGIRDRWREHFCELLNQNPSVNNAEVEKLPQFPVNDHLDEPPTPEEVVTAIRAMKNGKAVGPDGIPTEVYKAAGTDLAEKLHVLFTRIWEEEVIPCDLRDALIVRIFRKGEKTKCGNYRGISLLSIAGKILARILACRLTPIAEEILPESQCGFRPARGTVDMIFSARQIQEKCREQHRDLYMAFIDLAKAFDSVDRPTLWKILSRIGCSEKYIKIVRLLHDNMSASVLIDGEATESFEVKTGVKQGCVIAPTLFSIFISAVLYLVTERLPRGIDMQYRMDGKLFNLRRLRAKTLITHMTILELQYADDIAIMTHTEEDLQAAMDAFSQAYNALGLTLNARKTKVLFQPSPDNIHERHQPEITAGGQCLSSVDHFTYLGSCLSCKVDLDAEIQACLHSASGAFGRLRTRVFDNRDIYINTKINVYKAIILPTLLYGSEAWTTYSRHLKSLEKYHQRCLRRILNIKWQDRRTNSSVLEEANVTSIESIIIKNQLRWAGHIVRMPMSRLPKKILYGELSNGKRNQGGQRKRFKDNLKRNLKQCAINTEDWE